MPPEAMEPEVEDVVDEVEEPVLLEGLADEADDDGLVLDVLVEGLL